MTKIKVENTELILEDTDERVGILITDDDDTAVDASAGPELLVITSGGTVLHKDAYPFFTLTGTVDVTAGTTVFTGTNTKFLTELVPGDSVTVAAETLTVDTVPTNTRFTTTAVHIAGAAGATATKATRIVKPTGTGAYYILWGDATAPANIPNNTETATRRDVLFRWSATGAAGTERVHKIQKTRIVSACMMSLVQDLRILIDKAGKSVRDVPGFPCYLGYTDGMLAQYIEGGLQVINAYQPYPTFNTIDNFPVGVFGQTLLDTALMVGVMSQELFAIDTDIENFSAQGNAFVINHQPKLANFLNRMAQQLDARIPSLKRHFVQSGSVRTEMGPNFRLATLFNAAPSGALFRNVFFRG